MTKRALTSSVMRVTVSRDRDGSEAAMPHVYQRGRQCLHQPTTDGRALACPGQIAVPGRNCWRIARASRAAFLVDASAYFAAFAQAVENAQRSILILAWDIHSRTRLRPDRPASRYPDELGAFLDALV